jgi:hypothetical protein
MASPIQGAQPQGQPNQTQNQPIPGQQQGVPKSQQGTGYTNLSTLMNANQGNQLGSAVAGGIENVGQQTTNALNNGVQNFNQQAQANNLNTTQNQQNVQGVLSNLGIGSNGQSTNPTSVTGPSTGDVSNFQQYMAGQYGGPTNIANISGIQNQAQAAQQQGQDTSSAGGRQALLQQYAANPGSNYSAGDQYLDTALLGATGGNQLQQAAASVSGLNNQVNSASSAAQQQAQQITNQNAGFGQAVTGQVNNAVNNVYNPAVQTAQQYNAANLTNYNNSLTAQQNAQNGTISAQAAQALGLTNGQTLYGVNLGSDIGYDQNGNPITSASQLQQANATNVMSNPQYQQYSGLQQLLGQTAAAQGPAYQQGQTTYNNAQLQQQIAANPTAAAQAQYQQAQDMYNLMHQAGSTYGAQDTALQALYGNGTTQFGNIPQDVNWVAANQAQKLAALQAVQNQYGQTVNVTGLTPGTVNTGISGIGVNTNGSVQ